MPEIVFDYNNYSKTENKVCSLGGVQIPTCEIPRMKRNGLNRRMRALQGRPKGEVAHQRAEIEQELSRVERVLAAGGQ